MWEVHVVFQSKGGIGKSLVATFLTQYLREKWAFPSQVLAVDADGLNNSFSNTLQSGAAVVGADMATLTDAIRAHQGDVVIDTGPSSYLAMGEWLTSPETVSTLLKGGWTIKVHSIVVGGWAQAETLQGLLHAIQVLPPQIRLIVWLNDYFGPVLTPTGADFETMKIFTENRHRIWGLIRLRMRGRDLHVRDLMKMLARRQTFAEAVSDPTGYTLERSRLGLLRREIFGAISLVP